MRFRLRFECAIIDAVGFKRLASVAHLDLDEIFSGFHRYHDWAAAAILLLIPDSLLYSRFESLNKGHDIER